MQLEQLISRVRQHSPFYRDLYLDLPERGYTLEDLPLPDQGAFWKNNVFGKENRVLTGKPTGGMVFKSGGTTGKPKFSVYSWKEWQIFTRDFGLGLRQSGLESGDRVANLFYAGDLYASFSFINRSLEESPVPCLCFPVSGQMDRDRTLSLIMSYEVNVIMGVPVSIELLLQRAVETGVRLPVKKIFYGGEPARPHQVRFFQECLQQPLVASVGHASVDAGQIGYADGSCGPGEHLGFTGNTILEIVDEDTAAPVREPGVSGRLVLTSLYRELMPVIRYPVGDRALWVDYGCRKYRLLGRSEEGFRLGGTTIRWDELAELPEKIGAPASGNLQVFLDQNAGKDRMTLVLGTGQVEDENLRQRLTGSVLEKWPGIAKDLDCGLICPPGFRFVTGSELKRNSRTGKLLRIVDERV